MLGIFLNWKSPFPCFYPFITLFLIIGITCLLAEWHYCKEIEEICFLLRPQKGALGANFFMNGQGTCSIVFVVFPIAIVLIYGIGGCRMFGSLEFTFTLIWVLILFAIVVFVSIVGYIQYIFLAGYISKLSCSKERYTKLDKKSANYIPANITWIQKLTKLTHFYRAVFFTLGCFYILAFGCFCFLPDMKARRSSVWFYILWFIIFIAIVLAFPIVSLLERKWIKKIVQCLKESYISDLEKECAILKKSNANQLASIMVSISTRQIWDSKEYPFHAAWGNIYAAIVSMINFIATLTTICTDTLSFIGELQRFFL